MNERVTGCLKKGARLLPIPNDERSIVLRMVIDTWGILSYTSTSIESRTNLSWRSREASARVVLGNRAEQLPGRIAAEIFK